MYKRFQPIFTLAIFFILDSQLSEILGVQQSNLLYHAMKITSLLIGGVALLLASCGSGEKTATAPANIPVTEQAPVASIAPDAKPATKESSSSSKGGQVVESGKYHLELVPEKSANETHLDLYVQKGDDHQAISDAKVSGEVQSPDGQSKPITFTYDAGGKHYTGTLAGKTAGAYQLKVTATVGSDQADGRFSFNR